MLTNEVCTKVDELVESVGLDVVVLALTEYCQGMVDVTEGHKDWKSLRSRFGNLFDDLHMKYADRPEEEIL